MEVCSIDDHELNNQLEYPSVLASRGKLRMHLEKSL